MQDSVQAFRRDFEHFGMQGFNNYLAPWRRETFHAFLQLSLSPAQIRFLLNPENATVQFRAQFQGALNTSAEHLPQACIAATTTEPVAKLVTYLRSDDEAAHLDTIRKAATVLAIVENNFQKFLNGHAPEEALKTYKRVGEFACAAQYVVDTKGLKPVQRISELNGMHHIASVPREILARH